MRVARIVFLPLRKAARRLMAAVIRWQYLTERKWLRDRQHNRAIDLGGVERLREYCLPELNEAAHLEGRSLLKAYLRRFPYWCWGHLEYATNAAACDDVAAAYASAQAVLILEASESERAAALAVLGECYLRRGLDARAGELLTAALRKYPKHPLVIEKFAALLIARGKYSQAKELLAALPENAGGPEVEAAREFLRGAADREDEPS